MTGEGRNRSDSRLAGTAVGVLRPFLTNRAAETLYLAATARQYQHDFTGAPGLLDQALMVSPGEINARLCRATILTVRGDYGAAPADCRQTTAQRRPDIGFPCHATTEVLTAKSPGYATPLQQKLAQTDLLGPQLHGWATGLMADIWLADDKAPAAMDLLVPAPDTDAVLIRRVLAARVPGETKQGARPAAVLEKRFKVNFNLGLTAHARQEALYFLTIANNPRPALARAEVNRALQHQIEDVVLILQADEAARQPKAAHPAQDWMARNAVSRPLNDQSQ